MSKNKTTHLIAILDRSGSMQGQEQEVIGNFNYFLKEQQAVPGKAKLTLVLFDGMVETVIDQVNLKDVEPLTSDVYYTRGATAMNDAIGMTVSKLKSKKNAIVLIHTDGYENASKEYNASSVKALVDQQKKKWEFIFAGADIDAATISKNMGINRSVQVTNDRAGLADTYSNFVSCSTAYRTSVMDSKLDVSDKKTAI